MTVVVDGMVSTIIPVHNRATMLVDAVQSVISQTYRPIEVIVCDDNSTDGTFNVAMALAERYPDIVRAIRSQGKGAGMARETGRMEARGEFIQYLDSDDILLSNKFSVQVDALRRNVDCGAAYGFIRLQHPDGRFMDKPFKGSGASHNFLFPGILTERWWNTDCPLYRKSVTDAVGAWTDLPFSQDWEYDARVGSLGIRLVQVNDWVCVQRNHSNVRQTGSGKWLGPVDRVRFFSSLYKSAIAASVDKESPEMRRFSRWVFFHSRSAAYSSDVKSADKLLDISALAGAGIDVHCYRLAARIFGHRWAAVAFEVIRGRRPSLSLTGLGS